MTNKSANVFCSEKSKHIELQIKPSCTVYENNYGHYMVGITSPVFNTRQDAEKWAIDNGYRINTDY